MKCIFSCPADGVQTSTVVATEVAFRMQINRNDKHNTRPKRRFMCSTTNMATAQNFRGCVSKFLNN